MKNHSKPIMRRKVLETGVIGGAAIAFLHLWKLFSTSIHLSEFHCKSVIELSRETYEKLLEIACKYGCEFGDVCIKPKSRRKAYGSV